MVKYNQGTRNLSCYDNQRHTKTLMPCDLIAKQLNSLRHKTSKYFFSFDWLKKLFFYGQHSYAGESGETFHLLLCHY